MLPSINLRLFQQDVTVLMKKMRSRLWLMGCLQALMIAVPASTSMSAKADMQPRLVDILVTSSADNVVLYARLVDCFKAEMESAILAGVPAIFTIAVDVYQERSYVWDKSIVSKEIYRVIKYDNLKKTFAVTTNGQSQPVVFPDFESAQKAMAELSGFPIVPMSHLTKGENYSVHVKVKIDKVRLPFYMEYVFVFVSLWDFETPLYKIRFSY